MGFVIMKVSTDYSLSPMGERVRKKVLIIDDYLGDVTLYKEYLKNSKYYDFEFEVCDNAKSALESFSRMDADCVLLDYRLNDDDGIELMKKFKYRKFLRAPLIFMTTSPSKDVIDECLDLGASYFIDKNNLSNETLNKAVYYAINEIYDESFTDAKSFN